MRLDSYLKFLWKALLSIIKLCFLKFIFSSGFFIRIMWISISLLHYFTLSILISHTCKCVFVVADQIFVWHWLAQCGCITEQNVTSLPVCACSACPPCLCVSSMCARYCCLETQGKPIHRHVHIERPSLQVRVFGLKGLSPTWGIEIRRGF